MIFIHFLDYLILIRIMEMLEMFNLVQGSVILKLSTLIGT